MLVPDAALQNTCAGPDVIHCNFFSFIRMLASRCFSKCIYYRDCFSRGFLLHILRAPSLCASIEMPLFGHPLRLLFECILQDAVFCAPFEVPCDVHPSRCLVMCILRGAFCCAMCLAYLHPNFAEFYCCGALGEKRLPPIAFAFLCRRTFLYVICFYPGRRSLGCFLKNVSPPS